MFIVVDDLHDQSNVTCRRHSRFAKFETIRQRILQCPTSCWSSSGNNWSSFHARAFEWNQMASASTAIGRSRMSRRHLRSTPPWGRRLRSSVFPRNARAPMATPAAASICSDHSSSDSDRRVPGAVAGGASAACYHNDIAAPDEVHDEPRRRRSPPTASRPPESRRRSAPAQTDRSA